jgi:hypothetical protein
MGVLQTKKPKGSFDGGDVTLKCVDVFLTSKNAVI